MFLDLKKHIIWPGTTNDQAKGQEEVDNITNPSDLHHS